MQLSRWCLLALFAPFAVLQALAVGFGGFLGVFLDGVPDQVEPLVSVEGEVNGALGEFLFIGGGLVFQRVARTSAPASPHCSKKVSFRVCKGKVNPMAKQFKNLMDKMSSKRRQKIKERVQTLMREIPPQKITQQPLNRCEK